MYKTALVNSDISDGKRVVEELERMMPITAAFWFYREEDDEWKLVIVTPEIASKGPINLYSKVAVLLNDLSVDAHSPVVMPLSRITLTTQSSPSYQRIKEFGDAMGDAHIYKMG
jgi:hypothetical protein